MVSRAEEDTDLVASLTKRRMFNQRLYGPGMDTAAAVVGHLGAVQAQDYAGAKWALVQRTRDANDAEVERALDAGEILRTHVLRPTWHFVLPADIRWMLALSAPRVRALMAGMDRTLGLDHETLTRSLKLIAQALEGGRELTRGELATRLAAAGIASEHGQRMSHIMIHAELSALVCSGARRGKQATYTLLEERVPPAPAHRREEAVAELAARYFCSHGPATVHDFAWWSGLTVTDARAAAASLGAQLVEETIGTKTYWSSALAPERARKTVRSTPLVQLLPNFDEYIIAYKEHSLAYAPALRTAGRNLEVGRAGHFVLRDGLVIGAWRRTLETRRVSLELTLLEKLDRAGRVALQRAAEAYAESLGLEAVVVPY